MTESDLGRILSELFAAATQVFQEAMRSMILYGSYARGNYDKESDIDVLVLADIPNDACWSYRKRLTNVIDRLSLQYDVVVSLHIIDCETFERWENVVPFYRNIKQEGVIISA